MSNMSYCRFQNTLEDMQDCLDSITVGVGDEGDFSECSDNEKKAAKRMMQVAKDLVENLEFIL